MNLNPEIWGPHFWYTLHTISFYYQEYPTSTDMRLYKEFYESFVTMLPCKSCKLHYRRLLSQYPIDAHLNSRDSLSRWVVFIHNQVNRKLNKKEMAYDDVVKMYRKWFDQKKTLNKTKNYVFLLGSILAIAYLLYTYKS